MNKQRKEKINYISQLITDMTLKNAPQEHLERAIRYSEVVINKNSSEDDIDKSWEDNKIIELDKLYYCCLVNCHDCAQVRTCKKTSELIDADYAEGINYKIANYVKNTNLISDGCHTFGQLYYQRAMLFACIVNTHPDISWKTRKHEDGEPCFGGGWFLVTIDTPEGAYGYHYEDKYWDLFECPEIEKAKPWDGYDENDVTRLFSLSES